MKTVDFTTLTEEERLIAFFDLSAMLVELGEHRKAIEYLTDDNRLLAEEMADMFENVVYDEDDVDDGNEPDNDARIRHGQ